MATYLGTASGSTPGVQGDTTTISANGVKGTTTTGASAIYGYSTSTGAGVHGDSNQSFGYGVYGNASAYAGFAVYANSTNTGWGVYARGYIGVYAYCNQVGGYALKAGGDVDVTGTLTAATKNFVIDHPLDLENRLLRHSCVESSEMKNIYDGVSTADATGRITVQMPAWFEALNEDFRYQVTAVGSPAPNLHIKQEISQGRFVIEGAAPSQKVCWQVSGNRKDAYARAKPLRVEEDKPADERGLYLHPEVHGQPKEKGVDAKQPPPPPQPPSP